MRLFYPPFKTGSKNRWPDFYLLLDGLSYAVEVTQLVVEAENAFSGWLQNFIKEVEQTAKREGCLRGAYLIVFPRRIEKLRVSNVKSGLLEYIQSTYDLRSAPKRYILRLSNSQFCFIQKLQDKPDKIMWSGGYGNKWESEASVDVCNLLEQAITKKVSQLQRVRRPKILLLYDLYHWAPARAYYACKPKLSTLLSSFHTVFVVQSEGAGLILHSRNHKWVSKTK